MLDSIQLATILHHGPKVHAIIIQGITEPIISFSVAPEDLDKAQTYFRALGEVRSTHNVSTRIKGILPGFPRLTLRPKAIG